MNQLFVCAAGSDSAKIKEDEETMNRILAEGLKLKKRCKIQSSRIQEMEQRIESDQKEFEKQITDQHAHYESFVKQLRATLSKEMMEERDTSKRTIDDFKRQNENLKAENCRLQSTVVVLSETVDRLSEELNRNGNVYREELLKLQQNHQNDMREAEKNARENVAEELKTAAEKADTACTALELCRQEQKVSEERKDGELSALQSQVKNATMENQLQETAMAELKGQVVFLRRQYEEQRDKLQGLEGEKTELLSAAKLEIEILGARVAELLATKEAVEIGVQRVLRENENLRAKLDSRK